MKKYTFHPIKTHFQLFFILFVTAAVLVGLSLAVGTGIQPHLVAAQEPSASPSPPVNVFSAEQLATFGLSLEEIQAAAGPYDLRVTVSANPTTITSGGQAVFTSTITNLSNSNTAQYILFSQNLPSGMSGVSTSFGPGVTFISNGLNPPTYLLTNQITPGSSVQITVRGNISTSCNTIATYQTNVFPFETSADPNLNNNVASANVNVISGMICLYFPFIRRDPTPTPIPAVFYDNFSGSQKWSTADDGDCNRSYQSGEYEIEAETKDEDCFSPAPGEAEERYGTFKVKARRDSGSSDFTVAVYANGQGGDNYYAFEVRPNDNCGWKLIRLEDGDSDTLRSGGCDSPINRGSNANILELRHFSNGDIAVFVNGTQLGSTYNDSSQLTGDGTGVYARTHKDDDVTIRFDDFTVTGP